MSQAPLDALEAAIGSQVTIRLKSGQQYVGELTGYDHHMNAVLGSTTDTASSIPKQALGEEPHAVEQTLIVRGDNIVSITNVDED